MIFYFKLFQIYFLFNLLAKWFHFKDIHNLNFIKFKYLNPLKNIWYKKYRKIQRLKNIKEKKMNFNIPFIFNVNDSNRSSIIELSFTNKSKNI